MITTTGLLRFLNNRYDATLTHDMVKIIHVRVPGRGLVDVRDQDWIYGHPVLQELAGPDGIDVRAIARLIEHNYNQFCFHIEENGRILDRPHFTAEEIREGLRELEAGDPAPAQSYWSPGDELTVDRNQGQRDAVVLAVIGDQMIVEYTMPKGSSSLLLMTADRKAAPLRAVSYKALNRKWLNAIAAADIGWIGNPQQSGSGPIPFPTLELAAAN